MGRGTVWKAARGLMAQGLDVHAVRGRGYRLAEPLALLSPEAIRAGLGAEGREGLAELRVVASVDSTNRALLAEGARRGAGDHRAGAGGSAAGLRVLIAEHQSAGRGRRGREWCSPLGLNLYLSCLWHVDRPPIFLSAFSLVAGLVVAEVLEAAGVTDPRVKWPNDVWWNGRKMVGILLEMAGEPAGPCDLVVGIGMNVNAVGPAAMDVDQPWTSVREALGHPVDRNRLAARLLGGLLAARGRFEQDGLASFQDGYRRRDLLQGRPVSVHLAPGQRVEGTALGVDDGGALRVRTSTGTRRFHSGEVTVRLEPS